MREPERRDKDIDWNFWAFLIVSTWMMAFLAGHVKASQRLPDRCLVKLDNRSVAQVAIAVDGTVLDFPVKASEVILGRKSSFAIKYVESDLAISPLSSNSRSHLFVYLEGRRFTFDLTTTSGGGCPVISVRDSHDNQVSVDGFFRPKK